MAADRKSDVSWCEHRKSDPANETFAGHLYRNLNHLFTFLRRPGLDATNWRAEQAVRPAVVNRKLWGGHRAQPDCLRVDRELSKRAEAPRPRSLHIRDGTASPGGV